MSPQGARSPVGAVVLAAGASSRMGACKPLLRWGPETLLARCVRAAREGGCAPVFVVCGAEGDAVAAEARSVNAETVLNDRWRDGVGTSIAAGVASFMRDSGLAGVLIVACDQPLVQGDDLARIVGVFRGTGAGIVAADYGNGAFGIPAVFGRIWLPALLSLQADQGAKALIEGERPRTVFVDLPRAAIDADTPEDWERVRTRFRPSGYRTRNDPHGRKRFSNHPAIP